MICLLAEKFQQPLHVVRRWPFRDTMLLYKYWGEEAERRAEANATDSPAAMARMFGGG